MSARRTPSDRRPTDRVHRRITFVVTTRNSARTIERCIASLLSQGAQHEVIVVDHDSTDQTRLLVERSGVAIISAGASRGSRRNHGWERATGEFVCFVDGNQELDPGAAEEIVRTFEAFPSVAGLVAPERSFGDNYIAKGLELEKLSLQPDAAAESAWVFRASTLDQLGGLDDALPPPFDEFEFTDRLRINGLVVSKITRAIRRNEGRPAISTIYRRAVRYGAGWRSYKALRPTDRPMIQGGRRDRAVLLAAPWRVPALAVVSVVGRIGVTIGRWLTPRWPTASAPRSNAIDPIAEVSWIQRRAALIAYATPMAIAAITTLKWFSPGRSIAGGELGPFLPRSAISTATRFWGYTTTGAGSPLSEASRIFDGVLLGAVRLFGGGPSVAQHLLYAVLLALAVGGLVFFFRQILPGRQWIPSVVALLAVANPGFVSLLPDPYIPAALGASGYVAGVILRAARRPTSFRLLALATLPIAYVALDRSLLALVGFSAVLAAGCTAALSGRSGLFRAVRSIAPQMPVVAAVHAWWLVPELAGWRSEAAHQAASVASPLAAPSWTSIAAMASHRGWDTLPWSVHFDEWPLVAARWFFPIVALLAPLLAVERRLRRTAVGMLSVALAAAIATRSGNSLAVPGLVLVICYSTNALITFHGMFVRASRWRSSRHALRIAAVYLAIGIGVTGFPLFTGAIAPKSDGDSASRRVQVPEAWSKLGRDLDAARTFGKTLVLPTVSHHATTTWGYRGVADLPRHISSRPAILGSTDERSNEAFGAAIDLIERQLVGGSAEGLQRSLDSLGVSHVVVRHDLKSEPGTESFEPDALISALESSGLFGRSTRYASIATLFARLRAPSPVQMFTRVHTYDARDPNSGAASIARLPTDTAGIGVTGTPPNWASRGQATSSDRPAIGVRSVGPHGYRAYVHIRSPQDVILALVDAPHTGWQLLGVPAGAVVIPVTVDGFRQGWWVRASTSFDASISYRPAGLLAWTQRLSILALLFLCMSIVNRVRVKRLAKRPGNYLPALQEHRLEMRFADEPARDDHTEVDEDTSYLDLPSWLGQAAVAKTSVKVRLESKSPEEAPEEATHQPIPDQSGDLSELDAVLALQPR